MFPGGLPSRKTKCRFDRLLTSPEAARFPCRHESGRQIGTDCMAPLRIALSDWPADTHPVFDRMLRLLAIRLEVTRTGFEEADLLVYSDFGERHWGFKGLKVYLTGENMLPDFNECDLAYSPAEITGDPRAVRLPYYAQVLPEMGSLVRPPDYDPRIHIDRQEFACFVASNPRGPERNRFFKLLHRQRRVVSAGRHFNNTGVPLSDKMAFLEKFRFNLAFENSRSQGYVTEKLVEPLLAGTIPIYWGAPDVDREFNPGCMIDVSRYACDQDAIDHILAVDSDSGARMAFLSAPPFQGNRQPDCLSDNHLVGPLLNLINGGSKPGSRRYRHRVLRGHAYSSSLERKLSSLNCRLEGVLWKLGRRFGLNR